MKTGRPIITIGDFMKLPIQDIISELMKGDGKVFDMNYGHTYRGKRKVAIYARVSTEHEAQLSALANQKVYIPRD